MRVRNVHERRFRASREQAAKLLDSLSSHEDLLWPSKQWPHMRLDRPLGLGASGGHGPIRYAVVGYEPGERVTFKFIAPEGFVGTHWFEIVNHGSGGITLRHTIDMSLVGAAMLSWPIAIRPLHDALIEDALTNAQISLGEQPTLIAWSPWVRLLRRIVAVWIWVHSRCSNRR